jgi:CBS domain-containing protein
LRGHEVFTTHAPARRRTICAAERSDLLDGTLACRLLSPARMDPNKTKVSSVMSRDVVTAKGGDTLASVMEAMLSRSISHVPVVDSDRGLVGIVSKTDIVSDRHLQAETHETTVPKKMLRRGINYTLEAGFHLEVAPDITVDEVMTPVVVSISDQASVGEAAALMAAHQVHGLPVLSKSRGLVGFISAFDITSWVARN